MVVPLGGVLTTVVPLGVGECALDRPERTDCGHQLDQLEEEEEDATRLGKGWREAKVGFGREGSFCRRFRRRAELAALPG